LYKVNPPLVRLVAALPLLVSDCHTDWSATRNDTLYSRPEFAAGARFVKENGSASFTDIRLARWALIPLCLVGGWVCYRWARDLYGESAGLVAVILYAFCPNMLGWGSSITPDAVSASLGLLAGYCFWLWLRQPGWVGGLSAGAALGVAALTKTTWVVLFTLWPAIWLAWRLHHYHQGKGSTSSTTLRPPLVQIVGVLLIGIYVVNLGYVFDGSFKQLAEYRFISRTLSGKVRPPDGDNRFSHSWVGSLPIPFPESYVRGIDVQKFDFEEQNWSYLRGEQRQGGWWYYYAYCFLVKTPIGTFGLIALLFVVKGTDGRSSATFIDWVVLLAPAVVVFALVSSQTGFNRYFRYVLPALPYVYVAISRVGLAFASGPSAASLFALSLLVASVIESMAIFPHNLSFFNLAVGGPMGGRKHVVDANIDWGQDLLFLKRWYDAHPEARPLHLAYFGSRFIDPEVAEILWTPVPKIAVRSMTSRPDNRDVQPVGPGWYAISINHLAGYRHFKVDDPVYTYFQDMRPIGAAGYSIYIYHVLPRDGVNQRSELAE
jgi:hypothetical protein